MRQTLHIFKKDARGLRWEIALVLLLLAAFAYSDARLDWIATVHDQWNRILKLLVMLAWFVLIARVIQSEALAGDKQFWLTRPYSWKSLLAAKILFLLAFITLPMTIADSAIVAAQGFPMLGHLSGLIWMQLLWWIQFVLPIAVLAAITSSLSAVVFWTVVIIAAVVGSTDLTLDLVDPLRSLEWIGNTIYLTLTTAAIIAILIWQDGRRRTVDARIVFGCTLALSALAPILPLSGMLPLREPSSLTIRLDPQPRPVAGLGPHETVQVYFLLRIAGVPEGLTPRTDFTQVQIQSPVEQATWRNSPSSNSDRASVLEEKDVFWLQISMNRKFFERVKNQSVRIRVMLLLTLFGNQKSVTLPPGSKSMAVPEIGLCDTALPSPVLYRCRAPFRGPRLRLSTQGSVGLAGLSYTPTSPFPAELGVSPMWTTANFYDNSGGARDPSAGVTLSLEEPLAHLRRVLTLDNVRLTDY